MPAWTPENEGLTPFDENDDIKSELPPDFIDFINQFNLPKVFSISIKKWSNENYTGRPTNHGQMEGMVPEYESVVGRHGPGHYGFQTSWTPSKGGKPRTEIFKVNLTGPAWEELYEKAKEEKHAYDLAEVTRKGELLRARNLAAGLAPEVGRTSEVNPKEYMKSVVGDMKDLMEVFGGGMKPQNGNDSMGMMFMGMMQLMAKQSENNTNMLIALMQNNNKGNDAKEQMTLFRDMLSIRDGLLPKEESWIRETVSAISDNIGPIAGLFMRGNPVNDPLHQTMNEGLSDVREKAHASPAFLKAFVKHLDKKVGPKVADQILDGFMRVKRYGEPVSDPTPSDGPGAGESSQNDTEGG
jgi:hypothetical protein